MIKVSKPQAIPLDKIITSAEDTEHRINCRDLNHHYNPALADSLRKSGQLAVAHVLTLPNGLYLVLAGNCRGATLKKMFKEGIICEKTGKVIDTLLCHVHTDLTPAEMDEIVNDHSTMTTLTMAEFVRSMLQSFEWQMGNVEAVLSLHYEAFRQRYPGPDVETVEETKSRVRGRAQLLQKIHNGPTVLRETFMKKQRGEQSWPIDTEVRKFSELFVETRKLDPAKFDRDNPAPAFAEAWNAYVTAKIEATATGRKAKSAAMLNNQTLTTIRNSAKSKILNVAFAIVQNTPGGPSRDILPELDVKLDELEKSESGKLFIEWLSEKLVSVKA